MSGSEDEGEENSGPQSPSSALSLKEEDNDMDLEGDNYERWEEDGIGKRGWAPEATDETTATIEITMLCRNLVQLETFSKSDPVCVVFRKPPGTNKWIDFMRTEIVENDLNPDFAAKVVLDYYFDRAQPLRFQIHHMETPTEKLTQENSFGFVEILLSQIVQAGNYGLTVELNGRSYSTENNDKPPSTILLIAEEMASEKGKVVLKLGGSSIGTYLLGCFPPHSFIVISKMMYSDERYIIVYRSSVCRGQNPIWPTVQINCRSLCNGNYDRVLKIEIFQKNLASTSENISIGQTMVTLSSLLGQNSREKIPLFNELAQSVKGFLRVISCKVRPMHTFIDYIQTPMQIHCCFAIDFTCSNGNPEDIESLHYLSNNPDNPNLYEQAIIAVGKIIQDYNTSTLFTTLGFGARIPPVGDISYNFNVNLTDSPNCVTIDGVLKAYRECLTKIELYGPTYFTPVIKQIVQMAKTSRNGDHYYILIIMTDGVITDFDETKKTIVEASVYPLSIVIIGIGEMDFESMEELSARAWLTNTGEDTTGEFTKKGHVQIVQPVYTGSSSHSVKSKEEEEIEQEKESGDEKNPDSSMKVFMVPDEVIKEEDKNERALRILTQSQLAQEMLSEIPEQIASYMAAKNITPSMIRPPDAKKPGTISKIFETIKRVVAIT